jgi:uncharacterized membrane protein (UPF0127 family)
MPKIIKIIILFLFISLSVFLILNYFKNYSKKRGVVCFTINCFNVEIAKDQKDIAKGLMFRKKLNENEGMLFIFDKEGKYSFWMKNTLIPLDIIWLDKNQKIVYIKKNAQPCREEMFCPSFSPEKEAKYVLEILGGVSDKINLKIGDRAVFYFNYPIK